MAAEPGKCGAGSEANWGEAVDAGGVGSDEAKRADEGDAGEETMNEGDWARLERLLRLAVLHPDLSYEDMKLLQAAANIAAGRVAEHEAPRGSET